MAKRLVLRSWRVTKAEPSGLFVWFDPDRESVELYEVDPPWKRGVLAFGERDDQLDLLESILVSDRHSDDLPF